MSGREVKYLRVYERSCNSSRFGGGATHPKGRRKRLSPGPRDSRRPLAGKSYVLSEIESDRMWIVAQNEVV